MTVWIYDQGEELKVFATADAARDWFKDNDHQPLTKKPPLMPSDGFYAILSLGLWGPLRDWNSKISGAG